MNDTTLQALDETTYCSLSFLLKQSAQARLLKRGSKNIHAHQSGQHLSVYKGRGMDFTESRLYQSGDDVRLLDWRVTAKTGKPHTKVFSEERERPVMLIVDLRQSMFFATKGCYKSVMAAKIASMLIWKSLHDGDKAGGIILSSFIQEGHAQAKLHKPSRSQSAASRFINSIAKATKSCGTSQQQPLHNSLKQLTPIIETGTQIILLSDFRGLDEKAMQQLIVLTHKSSLTLISITDPLETAMVNNSKTSNSWLTSLRLSSGAKQIQLNKSQLLSYQNKWHDRESKLEALDRYHNIHRMHFSTIESSSEIMLKLSRGLA